MSGFVKVGDGGAGYPMVVATAFFIFLCILPRRGDDGKERQRARAQEEPKCRSLLPIKRLNMCREDRKSDTNKRVPSRLFKSRVRSYAPEMMCSC